MDWVTKIPLTVAAFLCLFWIGTSAYATWSDYVNFPLGDEWPYVAMKPSLQTLFTPHNEHRIAVSKILFLIDQNAFEGRGIFNLISVFTFQFVACLLVSMQIWRMQSLGEIEKSLLILLCFVLSFWSYNYENLTWGFQHQWTAVLCFSFSAFAIFLRDPKRARNVVLALLCVTLATFSLSNGIISGFVLVVVAVMMRTGLVTTAIIVTFTMVLLKAYLWGYPEYPSGNLLQALQQPEWVKYSLVYFGAPFRFVPGLEPVKVSLWCGAVVVSLSLYAITHCLRRRRYLDTSTLFAFAIVLFVGATGVLIAMGRTSLEISNMWASRYGSMVVMLFPALLMIMAPLTHWREVRWFPVAVMIAIIGYAVATEPRFLHEARYWTDARKGALTAAVVGVRDKEDMFCPCSLELILNQVATLRSRHQSIYAEDWPFWIGRELADSSISLVPRSQCGGSIEEITPVADGARVRGWIRDRAPQRASRVVIFADERNRIVGVALGGHVQYDDVPADRPESESQKIGWRGHVTGHYGSTTVQALGLGQNHSSACEFGVVSWPTAAPPIGEGSQ